MVRMTVLASGSRGNSTVVATENTRLLVDAGLSCRELLKRMRAAGEEPEKLSGILITHEHQDHVQGLAVLARKLGVPVYFTEATHRAWVRWMTPQKKMTYAEWIAQREAEKQRRTADSSGRRGDPQNDSSADCSADCSADYSAAPENEEENAGLSTAAADAASARDDNFVEGPAASENAKAVSGEEEKERNAGSSTAHESTGANSCSGRNDICEETPKGCAELTRLPAVEYFRAGETFSVGDIEVFPFTIPHDAADPVAFVFQSQGVRVAIATDMGYLPPNAKAALRRCNVLMIESNHDLEMLRDGPYPWSVKQRVMSRVGHLSNHALAEFLTKDYDGQAQYVVLAHLSENNNLPELARLSAESALREQMPLLLNRVVLAAQDTPLESIVL